jgi:GT2 family glycosyltransferase
VDEIVLVDNGSSDGSHELLARDYGDHHQIRLIRNEENRGFAYGVNQGIQCALASGACFVLLLNNDAVVQRSCIESMVAALETNALSGIAGPRIMYHKDRNRIWQGGGRFSLLRTGTVNPYKNRLHRSSASRSETVRKVGFLTACAVLVKSQVFEELGLFDEDFFLYGEDVDLCLRATRAGFELIYVPDAVVWHKIEGIVKDRTSPMVLYHLARSRLLMLRKRFPSYYFGYGLLVHLLIFTPYRIVQVFRGSRSARAVRAWLVGTIDGVVGGNPARDYLGLPPPVGTGSVTEGAQS